MKMVLLRVGIDSGSGGMQGPLFEDGGFEYIPVPDMFDKRGVDERTYGNTMGGLSKKLIEYFPSTKQERMRDCPIHFDPEFESFTYGDPTSTKSGLRRLSQGDFLVFYCGLQGYDFDSEPSLYLIGYFEVEFAGKVGDLTGINIKQVFANNFHVKHKEVFEQQKDRLVLVKGNSNSRLLKKAVKISAYGQDRSGKRLKVLSPEAQKMFGDFGGKITIQRCPPRWVDNSFVHSAKQYLASLE